MARPPRDPAVGVISRGEYARLGREPATITASAMAAYLAGLARYGKGTSAGTMAFLTAHRRSTVAWMEYPLASAWNGTRAQSGYSQRHDGWSWFARRLPACPKPEDARRRGAHWRNRLHDVCDRRDVRLLGKPVDATASRCSRTDLPACRIRKEEFAICSRVGPLRL